MNRTPAFSIGVAGLFVLNLPNSLGATNDSAPRWAHYPLDELYITNTNKSTTVSERYLQEMVAGSYHYYDRFGPPSFFNWTIAFNQEGYGIHQRISRTGRDVVKNILANSARETAVGILPIDDFKSDGKSFGYNLIAGFVEGSVGNTEELSAQPVSAQSSYHSLKNLTQFDWENDDGSWKFQYGWRRVFSDTPYLYLNNNIGRSSGRQLLHTELRCYGYLRPDDFGLIKIETQATLTMGRRSQLVFGGRIYPNDMDSEEHGMQGSVRFETVWRKSILSFGASSAPTGQFYSAMYTLGF